MWYIVPFIRDLVYIYVNIPEYLSLFIYYFYKMPRLLIVIFSIIYYILFQILISRVYDLKINAHVVLFWPAVHLLQALSINYLSLIHLIVSNIL